MSINTNLKGRLRNTTLHRNQGLMPLFEAVVNSIYAIAEESTDPGYGKIAIEIIRAPQTKLDLENGKPRRGAPPQEPIVGFQITDNGVGFNDQNMVSFETLDSDYKAKQGCRGVGRLLWLKAFEAVNVSSNFKDEKGEVKSRSFTFTAAHGIGNLAIKDLPLSSAVGSCIDLSGFEKAYREASPKTAATIANTLFEHCLWYFVRDGGAPTMKIRDGLEVIDLEDVYKDYMQSSSTKEAITIKGKDFELTHLSRLLKYPAAKSTPQWLDALSA